MKKPVISFRIEPEQTEALNRLCDATGKDRTEHMRKALEQYLELEHLKALHASVKVPNLCGCCGANLDYHQCFCKTNHVGIVSNPPDRDATIIVSGNRPKLITQSCGLGEHCRCKAGDEPGCWNWPE